MTGKRSVKDWIYWRIARETSFLSFCYRRFRLKLYLGRRSFWERWTIVSFPEFKGTLSSMNIFFSLRYFFIVASTTKNVLWKNLKFSVCNTIIKFEKKQKKTINLLRIILVQKTLITYFCIFSGWLLLLYLRRTQLILMNGYSLKDVPCLERLLGFNSISDLKWNSYIWIKAKDDVENISSL